MILETIHIKRSVNHDNRLLTISYVNHSIQRMYFDQDIALCKIKHIVVCVILNIIMQIYKNS